MTRGNRNKRKFIQRIAEHTNIRTDVVEIILNGIIDVGIEEIVNTGELQIRQLFDVSSAEWGGYNIGAQKVKSHSRLKITLSNTVRELWKTRHNTYNGDTVSITKDNWREILKNKRAPKNSKQLPAPIKQVDEIDKTLTIPETNPVTETISEVTVAPKVNNTDLSTVAPVNKAQKTETMIPEAYMAPVTDSEKSNKPADQISVVKPVDNTLKPVSIPQHVAPTPQSSAPLRERTPEKAFNDTVQSEKAASTDVNRQKPTEQKPQPVQSGSPVPILRKPVVNNPAAPVQPTRRSNNAAQVPVNDIKTSRSALSDKPAHQDTGNIKSVPTVPKLRFPSTPVAPIKQQSPSGPNSVTRNPENRDTSLGQGQKPVQPSESLTDRNNGQRRAPQHPVERTERHLAGPRAPQANNSTNSGVKMPQAPLKPSVSTGPNQPNGSLNNGPRRVPKTDMRAPVIPVPVEDDYNPFIDDEDDD